MPKNNSQQRKKLRRARADNRELRMFERICGHSHTERGYKMCLEHNTSLGNRVGPYLLS